MLSDYCTIALYQLHTATSKQLQSNTHFTTIISQILDISSEEGNCKASCKCLQPSNHVTIDIVEDNLSISAEWN